MRIALAETPAVTAQRMDQRGVAGVDQIRRGMIRDQNVAIATGSALGEPVSGGIGTKPGRYRSVRTESEPGTTKCATCGRTSPLEA